MGGACAIRGTGSSGTARRRPDGFDRYRRTRAWTPEDRAFSRTMTRALVAFAPTGNPATAALAWPRFDPADPQLLRLAATASRAPWPDERRFAFFRALSRPSATGGAVRD